MINHELRGCTYSYKLLARVLSEVVQCVTLLVMTYKRWWSSTWGMIQVMVTILSNWLILPFTRPRLIPFITNLSTSSLPLNSLHFYISSNFNSLLFFSSRKANSSNPIIFIFSSMTSLLLTSCGNWLRVDWFSRMNWEYLGTWPALNISSRV